MTGQQLKNSILQEAIEGRLVPQDPNDEPASVLLERIRAEKARLVKEKKIKKDKNESRIYRTEDGHWMEHFEDKSREDVCIDEEIPFELPSGWEWCRWGMLGDYKKGPFGSSLTKSMFVPLSKTSVKVYEQKNAIQKDFSIGDYYISQEKYKTMEGFTVYPGDIIVSCAGTIGETYKIPKEAPLGIINQALMRARLFDEDIVDYWMLYFHYILIIENKLKGSGSAIKNIPPFDVLKKMLVAIPPMHEQKRILEKIYKLNVLSEAYGKAQEELVKLTEALPEQLKKSILQEAIEGHLVPQDPNDEPASVLLERIRAEKARLVKEKKIKKDKNESRIYRTDDGHWMEHFEDKNREDICIDEEIPFDVPSGWEWERWGNISQSIQYGYNAPSEVSGIIRMVRISDIQENKVIWDSVPYCNIKESDIDNYLLCPNDILFARTGGTVGKSFLVKDTPYKAIYAGYLIRTRYSNMLRPEYLKYYMESRLYWEQLRNGTIATAQPNCNGQTLSKMFVPIPPLAEQHRIVEMIESLLPKIEKLKVNI